MLITKTRLLLRPIRQRLLTQPILTLLTLGHPLSESLQAAHRRLITKQHTPQLNTSSRAKLFKKQPARKREQQSIPATADIHIQPKIFPKRVTTLSAWTLRKPSSSPPQPAPKPLYIIINVQTAAQAVRESQTQHIQTDLLSVTATLTL